MRRRASNRRPITRVCLAADTGLALDILADILTETVFEPAELEREKDVILQEIGAVEDTPDDLVFDLFNAAAYPEQPIGRPILGTPEQVASVRPRVGRRLSRTSLSRPGRDGHRGGRRGGTPAHRRRGRAALRQP